MDSDFVQKLQNIKLTEDEGVVIRVGSVHRDRILEECSLSLLGRFFTHRSFNQCVAKTLLRFVWKMGSDVRIVDVGDGVFQFKFSMESQLKWVLANGPWSFEDHPLVLCRWERGMIAASVRFTSIPMWVQVWGLPFDLLSKEVRRDVGNGLGKVVEVDQKVFSSDQARFLRVRVELPLEKPLCRGGVVASPKGDKVCIGFKYERLVGLCFKCGRIGHEVQDCSFHVEHQQELPYGEWLKAGFRQTTTSANNGGRSELREINAQMGPSSAAGPSKGGAKVESVEKAGRVASTAGKLTPNFEAIITELDQAIQSEPTISNSKSIREEQLMANSEFYLGLVHVEVMDEDLTLRKHLSSSKQIVSCDDLIL
ncbi:hypothetical protein SO802_025930 [Lithocarpus litseifolius]|uniref:CCHC-type domain-containing protein n=1 Tax=Lithocarpus litseifolius TaxID=425828 RepID=A0AAW2C3J9_9ROSI